MIWRMRDCSTVKYSREDSQSVEDISSKSAGVAMRMKMEELEECTLLLGLCQEFPRGPLEKFLLFFLCGVEIDQKRAICYEYSPSGTRKWDPRVVNRSRPLYVRFLA